MSILAKLADAVKGAIGVKAGGMMPDAGGMLPSANMMKIDTGGFESKGFVEPKGGGESKGVGDIQGSGIAEAVGGLRDAGHLDLLASSMRETSTAAAPMTGIVLQAADGQVLS